MLVRTHKYIKKAINSYKLMAETHFKQRAICYNKLRFLHIWAWYLSTEIIQQFVLL